MASHRQNGAAKSAGTCPICQDGTAVDYRPFCSKRCADVDLSRWLSGTYAIPVTENDDEDGDGTPDINESGMPH